MFVVPVKRIKDESKDLPFFQTSEAYARIMSYILALNTAVLDRKVSDPLPESESIQKILTLLETLDSWIALVPLKSDPQRFGNLAFRDYIRMVEQKTTSLLEELLPPSLHLAVPEITPYLTQSLGHGTRIDYGSGHELSFVAWLCCLEIIGFLHQRDHPAVVLRVFVRYLELVRKLQRTYQLEPAGSHGVWGLDDYQFLPYLWGSSQLRDHPTLKPISIMKVENLKAYAPDYLYFRAIQFIHETKRGPFHEHSSVLFEISGVPHWAKVNSGMIKMYKAEVLNKFPVVQHLLFGGLLPWRAADSPPDDQTASATSTTVPSSVLSTAPTSTTPYLMSSRPNMPPPSTRPLMPSAVPR
ncbi:putative phosphotyrosyl phosphatase activator [Lobosporangium transversale]|uniref:Serine/threonine-protein phosphatase 2A activator n=1 Tax=Lobosporangium transversale TaxID=64571 RepID=A0A1Y2GX57_9FUNG|nr:putative phosphotyrosyl phosphatase activator [Lobosporangium transversale]ORZ26351.1 putative phosphotyrosyl phosphatase activator [Lobosporangium transversale]|eukprot:XP_021884116.1 putative phosphotyrosyl phosphatase activator [Lobosporangium transversale]